jgi:hypothetical protein
MRMDFKSLQNAAWPSGEESRIAAPPIAQAVRQPQSMTSLVMPEQQSAYQNENRELVRMLVGLLGLVSLVFMALFAMIRL